MSKDTYEPPTGRSKFTEERRVKILECLACGASLQTTAAIARISLETLYRWLRKGENAAEDSQWHKFFLDCQEARALPKQRALKVVHDAMPDYPLLAWKYIERVEPGYAPPTFAAPAATGPIVIQLSFSDGAPLQAPESEFSQGEVIDVEPAEPAALPSP